MSRSDASNPGDDAANQDSWPYPFGLSSRATFALVVVVGLVGTGLVVSLLESANQPLLGDIVWILGYGTTVFVVWYIWIRPIEIVGDTGQDRTSRDEEETEQSDSNGGDTSDGSSASSPPPDATNADETTTETGDPKQDDPPSDSEGTETG